jgi:hypothetical protein
MDTAMSHGDLGEDEILAADEVSEYGTRQKFNAYLASNKSKPESSRWPILNRTGPYLHVVKLFACENHPQYRFLAAARGGKQRFAGVRIGYGLQFWV